MFWKKKNKGPVIEKIVLQLIEMGQPLGSLRSVSLKDAAHYASQTPDPLVTPKFVQCYPTINNQTYKLEFNPRSDGGTLMHAWHMGHQNEVDLKIHTQMKGTF